MWIKLIFYENHPISLGSPTTKLYISWINSTDLIYVCFMYTWDCLLLQEIKNVLELVLKNH